MEQTRKDCIEKVVGNMKVAGSKASLRIGKDRRYFLNN